MLIVGPLWPCGPLRSPRTSAAVIQAQPLVREVPWVETEVIPGKHPYTRIEPLLMIMTNGHGRHITATPERALVSVGEWSLHIAVINLLPLPFHFRNGYVTAV
jgi:hypothetical protein